jgi:2-iminoacetate synthase ThiH
VNTISVQELTTLVREAGFTPVQRSTTYEPLKEW